MSEIRQRHRLFVYGELCKPAVLMDQLGRVPMAVPAVAAGYLRVMNPRTGFYRAIPHDGGRLPGLLLDGLETEDLAFLDEFENVAGGWYARCRTEVTPLTDPKAPTSAWIYVAGDVKPVAP